MNASKLNTTQTSPQVESPQMRSDEPVASSHTGALTKWEKTLAPKAVKQKKGVLFDQLQKRTSPDLIEY